MGFHTAYRRDMSFELMDQIFGLTLTFLICWPPKFISPTLEVYRPQHPAAVMPCWCGGTAGRTRRRRSCSLAPPRDGSAQHDDSWPFHFFRTGGEVIKGINFILRGRTRFWRRGMENCFWIKFELSTLKYSWSISESWHYSSGSWNNLSVSLPCLQFFER